LMRDSLLTTARPELSHTHRLTTTAPVTINSTRKKTLDQILQAFSTAQTSMRDSPLSMVRPELSHTHKLVTTAPQSMPLSRRTPRNEQDQIVYNQWNTNEKEAGLWHIASSVLSKEELMFKRYFNINYLSKQWIIR
jgi:hypothetical protein